MSQQWVQHTEVLPDSGAAENVLDETVFECMNPRQSTK